MEREREVGRNWRKKISTNEFLAIAITHHGRVGVVS